MKVLFVAKAATLLILAFIVAAVLVTGFLSFYMSLSSLRVVRIGLGVLPDLSKIGAATINVPAKVYVENRADRDFSLDNVVLFVKTGSGKTLAYGSSGPVIVPGNSITPVTLNLQVDVEETLKAIMNKEEAVIEGFMEVKAEVFNIKTPFTVKTSFKITSEEIRQQETTTPQITVEPLVEKLEIINAYAQWNPKYNVWVAVLVVANTGNMDAKIKEIIVNGKPISRLSGAHAFAYNREITNVKLVKYSCTEATITPSATKPQNIIIKEGEKATIIVILPSAKAGCKTVFSSGQIIEVKIASTTGNEYPKSLQLP